MISFILCSVNPDKAQATCENIRSTVGCDHECIVIDNRESPRSIAQVYNDGAGRAKGEALCFVHEDVRFHTQGFGSDIEDKLMSPATGVIGYLGTLYKAEAPSGWYVHNNLSVKHYIQSGHRGTDRCITRNLSAEGFTPVVAVDGCCMFVSKTVWAAHPFDEKIITGFHVYDIDFCLTLHHAGYVNYVCSRSMIEHMSYGSYSLQWILSTLTLHREKWCGKLPMSVKGLELTAQQQQIYEQNAWYDFLKKCIKSPLPLRRLYLLIQDAKNDGFPTSLSIKLWYKTLFYRLLK